MVTPVSSAPEPSRSGLVRRCQSLRRDGRACRAYPVRDLPYCFWHAPETEEDAADARRLGGLRRRREKTVTGAYELGPLDTPEGMQRVVDIAVVDTLSLDNSVGRNRTLLQGVLTALKVRDAGDLETRVAHLEAALARRVTPAAGDLLADDEDEDALFPETGA